MSHHARGSNRRPDSGHRISTNLLKTPILIVSLLASPCLMATETESASEQSGLVSDRFQREHEVEDNRSVLLAHKRNYILPVTYMKHPNNDPIADIVEDADDTLDNAEATFQLSIKTRLAEDLFTESGSLYAAFTLRAFWQAYNDDLSSPFRETNYEPELFWLTPVSWNVFGADATGLGFGIVHQSNGRNLPFSRSWNRIYANLLWEKNSYAFSFKPWWRIPEDDKDDASDTDGDDNPDIEDFMGNFELTAAYRNDDHEYSMMLRNNLDSDENRGAIQLDWTFPLHRRLRGYAQLFNGYGESLVDYDAHIERFGIGIVLSDYL